MTCVIVSIACLFHLCAMKTFLVILISIHLSTGNILLTELTKLPALVEHFYLFKRIHPEAANLYRFLLLHYSSQQHQSSDQSHGNLPFMHFHLSVADQQAPDHIEMNGLIQFSEEPLPCPTGYQILFSNNFSLGIKRPPRV
jgi:hypothetical protein